MPLKIRLRQQGRRNRLTYRIVVADARSPRDGKYVDKLGHYDPHSESDSALSLEEEKIKYWLERGAQFSEKAESLVLNNSSLIHTMIKERKIEKKKKLKKKK